jgi:AcrR family transcriptional regulator
MNPRLTHWDAAMSTIEPALGLRERGKRDRLQRLHHAAAAVFRSRGYDAATTREIAQLADVSVGTLFVYAKDKRDLLFLVINDDLDAVLKGALVAAARPAGLLDRLAELLGPIYAYFASELELARATLREVVHFDRPASNVGEQAQRYIRRLSTWQNALAEALAQAGRAERLQLDVPADLLARVLFDVHLVEVRRWMNAEQPDAARGQAMLRQMFAVVLQHRLR